MAAALHRRPPPPPLCTHVCAQGLWRHIQGVYARTYTHTHTRALSMHIHAKRPHERVPHTNLNRAREFNRTHAPHSRTEVCVCVYVSAEVERRASVDYMFAVSARITRYNRNYELVSYSCCYHRVRGYVCIIHAAARAQLPALYMRAVADAAT